jgi:hypothetical protein
MDGISMNPKTKLASYVVSEMGMAISSLFYFFTHSGFGIALTLPSGWQSLVLSNGSVPLSQPVSSILSKQL